MVTIKDISEKTQLSMATVSRILNHDPTLKVPEATRSRVLEEAKKMGYIKRQFKRRSNYRPMKVGIVQWYTVERELQDPYYLSIRSSAESVLNRSQAEIIRHYSNDNHQNDLAGADGLICIGKFSRQEIADFRKITDRLIFVDMNMERIFVNSLVLDFRNAMIDALNYLISLGHNRIGFLGGIETTADGRIYPDQRKRWFQEYSQLRGISWKRYFYEGEFTIESGYRMMTEMILSKELPTAVFAASDSIALGAMRALNEHQLQIPQDISLIGFNNDPTSAFTNPPLTTINAPCEKMGEIAAMTLIEMRSSKKIYPRRITIPCELVIRQSCLAYKGR